MSVLHGLLLAFAQRAFAQSSVHASPKLRSVRGRLVVFIRGHCLSRDFAKMMLTHRPVYARPLDPLHNFKIKVTVKKIRSGDVQRKGKNKKKKKKKKKNLMMRKMKMLPRTRI